MKETLNRRRIRLDYFIHNTCCPRGYMDTGQSAFPNGEILVPIPCSALSTCKPSFLSIVTSNHLCRAPIPQRHLTAESPAPKYGWFERLRVEGLCLSNDILSDGDQSIARELLSEAQNDLAFVDEDISQLQEILKRLKKRSILSAERVERLRVGIAPQKKLPLEVLSRIFIASLGPEGVLLPPKRNSSPWNVGQVCSRWRAISRADRLVWRFIGITNYRYQSQFSDSIISALHDILTNRGGQGAVELYARLRDGAEWADTLYMVSTYPSRLSGLHLDLDKSCVPALTAPLRAFNNLRSLSLQLRLYSGHTSQISAFSTARNLRSLKLDLLGNPGLVDNNPAMFLWAQLTNLTLTDVNSNSVFFILSRCILLVTLDVQFVEDGTENTQPARSIISLNRLENMYVFIDKAGSLKKALEKLALPSLKMLQIDGYFIDGWINEAGLTAFFRRCTCPIQSFRITRAATTVEDLIPLMRAVPTLAELVVLTTEPVVGSTLHKINTERLLPNLRRLEGWGFSSARLALDFLNCRWSRGASGVYEGIQDSILWLERTDSLTADQESLNRVLPDLRKNGRRVHLKLGYYYWY